MARLNNKDIHSANTPLYGWGLSLDLTGKGYEVSKRTWATLADAQAYVDDANDSAAPGNILTVVNDNNNDVNNNGVYLVTAVKGYKLGKVNASDTYNSIIADATITKGVLVKLGSDADIARLKQRVTALESVQAEHTTKIAKNTEDIATINATLGGLDTTYVKKTATIAGIDLQDDITSTELANALKADLGVEDLNYIKGVQANGKDLTVDENKKVNITAKDLGLDKAINFKGKVESLPIDTTGYAAGDVILVGNKEYILDENKAWVEFGDEGSYALKTVQVIAGDGLEGGGALNNNVTVSLADVAAATVTTATKVKLSQTPVEVITGVERNAKGQVTAIAKTPIVAPETTVSAANAKYVNVTSATDADGNTTFGVEATIGSMADANLSNSLADAKDVKDYVDDQIKTVSGNIAAADVVNGDYVTVATETAGVKSTYTVGVTTQTINDASTTAKGLAEASDVKTYVDSTVSAATAAITHTTVSAKDSYTTITATGKQYDVAVNTAAVATVSAAGNVADAYDVKEYVDTKSVSLASGDETRIKVELDEGVGEYNVTPIMAAVSEAKVGLADAKDVKTYVDAQVSAVSAAVGAIKHSTVAVASAAAGEFVQSDYISVTPTANDASAIDYSIKLNIVSIAADNQGLADAADVKQYVDGKETAINTTITNKLSWTEL